MWCVYLLHWKRWYVGSTNDLERRMVEHKTKGYSAKRIGEWKCVWYIVCKGRIDARRLEKEIKKSCHPERYMQRDDFYPHDGPVAQPVEQ